MKPKAVGTIKKIGTGYFTVKLEIGHPSDLACYEARARKRMKDAIADCNAAAEKLGWEVVGYEK